MMIMKKNRGFTLIEILIVLVLVSIISSFAYSSYSKNIVKTRRIDSQAALMSFAAAMERHYIAKGSYLGSDNGEEPDSNGYLTPNAKVFASEAPLDGSAKYYDLRIKALSETAYTLFAIPKGPQAGDGKLRLSSTGERVWDKSDNNSFSEAW